MWQRECPFAKKTAATDLGIETAVGKRRCTSNRWKRIWEDRRRAKRVDRLCKMNPAAQKFTMTGIHPVQVHGPTAQGASTTQVNAMCRNMKEDTVMGKTRACAVSTVALFFVTKQVPQGATRVEQVSEWITMWRGFNADTRRRISKVWREIAPYSVPPSVRFWERAGNQARQFSGSRQTPVPPLTALCSMRHRLSTVSPETWRCNYGRKLLGIRSVQAWRKVS